ncbi:MAG: hypothetical protein HZC50_01525 [Nitrospirae bacterium]|nr:hypothetical protein [Nitrospirota bacterium]
MTATTTPTVFTHADYVELEHVFAGGDISKATKAELERFAVMLSRPNAYTQFGVSSFLQACETVRTLLIVRMSEEANDEATQISKIALYIAMAALGCTFVQMLAAWWPKFS